MKITLTKVKIAELIDGFKDNGDLGVVGYHGKLDIRPKYQREFVYKDKQKKAVIETISKGFPLNVMYWCKKDDDTFELLDGQQRTMSIGKYYGGEFSIEWDGDLRGYANLTPAQKKQFLDYEILVYVCEGDDKEKLDWFQVINIAGEKLEDQEIRNAVYSGPWVSEAKKYFSKTGCVAQRVSDGYVDAKWIRQLGLQKAIEWICLRDGIKEVKEYMAKHQADADCDELWKYFQEVVKWAQTTFPKKRKQLTSVDWGKMYYEVVIKCSIVSIPSPADLEKKIEALMKDDEVENKAGIYWYVLDGDERHLDLRVFSEKIRTEVYSTQKGVCPICKKTFDISDMEADHIVPWHKGGLTVKENCQMLCMPCNRKKSGK